MRYWILSVADEKYVLCGLSVTYNALNHGLRGFLTFYTERAVAERETVEPTGNDWDCPPWLSSILSCLAELTSHEK